MNVDDRPLVHFYRDGSNDDGYVYVAVLHRRHCGWVRHLNIVAGVLRRVNGNSSWFLYDTPQEAREAAFEYLAEREGEHNVEVKDRPECNRCPRG